jgi:uncharacterized protein YeaO (DUF488 family)
MICIKRVYDPAHADDGYRVLVDRLWPRGLTREAVRIDEWAKVIAPSTELRIWFGHSTDRWLEFQQRYRVELTEREAVMALARLGGIARAGPMTLLTATRDQTCNQAIVLADVLSETDRKVE